MKSILELCKWARNKDNFVSLDDYMSFGLRFVDFISAPNNIEAKIVSRNENNYKFLQYKKDAAFNITRPINSNLYLDEEIIDSSFQFFASAMKDSTNIKDLSSKERELLNKCIYTIQQSIGCALDALPASENNTAKKINGDLFEKFMLLIFKALQFNVENLVEHVSLEDVPDFKVRYQHDLAFKVEGDLRLIGSVKTSSKDRIDKVFIDKFLYNQIRKTDVPHFAIFLNDVQRKKNLRNEADFSISQTFLRGHFKGYSISLSPLDGVYYSDLRPVMKDDLFLKKEIKRLDELICKDIWKLIDQKARKKVD